MLIADWYNKSWVRGKRERRTLVLQRLPELLLLPLAAIIAHHPHALDWADDEKQVQTMQEIAP